MAKQVPTKVVRHLSNTPPRKPKKKTKDHSKQHALSVAASGVWPFHLLGGCSSQEIVRSSRVFIFWQIRQPHLTRAATIHQRSERIWIAKFRPQAVDAKLLLESQTVQTAKVLQSRSIRCRRRPRWSATRLATAAIPQNLERATKLKVAHSWHLVWGVCRVTLHAGL